MVYQPLFMVWNEDPNTDFYLQPLEYQYLIGDSLMSTPVLTSSKDSVKAYFPVGTWYSFSTGKKAIGVLETPVFMEVKSLIDEGPPLFIRGGKIVYSQSMENVKRTSDLTNVFDLVIALESMEFTKTGLKGENSSEAKGEERESYIGAQAIVVVIGDHNNETLVEECAFNRIAGSR